LKKWITANQQHKHQLSKNEPYTKIKMLKMDVLPSTTSVDRDAIKREIEERRDRLIQASVEDRKKLLQEEAMFTTSTKSFWDGGLWKNIRDLILGFVAIGLIYYGKIIWYDSIWKGENFYEIFKTFEGGWTWRSLYHALDVAYDSRLGAESRQLLEPVVSKSLLKFDPKTPFFTMMFDPKAVYNKPRTLPSLSSDDKPESGDSSRLQPKYQDLVDRGEAKLKEINGLREKAGMAPLEFLPVLEAHKLNCVWTVDHRQRDPPLQKHWLPKFTLVFTDTHIQRPTEEMYMFAKKLNRKLMDRGIYAEVVCWDTGIYRDHSFKRNFAGKFLKFLGNSDCRRLPGYLASNSILPFMQQMSWTPNLMDLDRDLDSVLVIDFGEAMTAAYPANTLQAPAGMRFHNIELPSEMSSPSEIAEKPMSAEEAFGHFLLNHLMDLAISSDETHIYRDISVPEIIQRAHEYNAAGQQPSSGDSWLNHWVSHIQSEAAASVVEQQGAGFIGTDAPPEPTRRGFFSYFGSLRSMIFPRRPTSDQQY